MSISNERRLRIDWDAFERARERCEQITNELRESRRRREAGGASGETMGVDGLISDEANEPAASAGAPTERQRPAWNRKLNSGLPREA